LVGDAQDLEGLREIGVGDIGRAQQVATRLASAYLANPDADSVWAAKAHAYTLLDILESGRAKMTLGVKAQLQSVASDAASLAGYGDMNAGRLDQADRWFDAALGLAREAGDRRLESLAHVGHAWNLLEGFNGPNRAAALESLGRSAQFHRFLPPAARAYVFGSLARERAAIGDDLVSGRFLEWSRSASVLIPYEEPGWGWYSTRGTLFGWESGPRPLYEGLRSLRLRRPQEALDLFERGLATEKSQLARLGLLTSMMEACVGLDDPERACLFGTASLDEAKNLDVGAGWERNAYASFPLEWRSLRPVMAFGERLRLAA
jgi:tetratricopeptide (TPR) repeat protein